MKTSPVVASIVKKILLEASNVKYVNPDFTWNAVSVDPDDNKFFDTAVAAGADYIVTNDNHFNDAKKLAFPKVNIVTTGEFSVIVQGLKP